MLRTEFRRYVWAILTLGSFLMMSIFFLDYVDDPGNNDSVWILLAGSLASAALGYLVGPRVSIMLGFLPNRHVGRGRSAHRSKR